MKGYSALKEISEVIRDPALAITKHGGPSLQEVLVTLTSRYYSVIPHAFGRQVPPTVNSIERLKREAELIESLGEMEIAAEIISNVSASSCPMAHRSRLQIFRKLIEISTQLIVILNLFDLMNFDQAHPTIQSACTNVIS
jgi:Poly(ADP-ribose) polymerase, regulatory domain